MPEGGVGQSSPGSAVARPSDGASRGRRAARGTISAPTRRGAPLTAQRPSPAVQDYLKAIYLLDESADMSAPVTTTAVAEALAVTTASASNMLKKLDGLGYVDQVPRHGVALTDAGRQAALEVIRHHRLLETYLATRLGMSWDEVHREAEVLEHHVSEALADRIAEALGHPERDPHGHPIPTSAGLMPSVPSRRLSEMAEGAEAVVGRVDDRDDALLRFLAERGLVPEAHVTVLAHAPFGGPISVRVGERVIDVPPAAAHAVHVE
jgi:DtxR family Mn-dependent transcriptional regulator